MVSRKSRQEFKKPVVSKIDEEVDYAGRADMMAGAIGSDSDEDRETSFENEDSNSSAGDNSDHSHDLPDDRKFKSGDAFVDDGGGMHGDGDESDSSQQEGSSVDEPRHDIENSDSGEEDSENAEEESNDEREDSDSDDIVFNDPHRQNSIKIQSEIGEQCTFDLRNLLATNAHQMNLKILYGSKSGSQNGLEHVTITAPDANVKLVPNEGYLLQKAVDGCSQLIRALWQLPAERSDAGPLIQLPTFDENRMPRSLPPPPPKKETKWEKFAKEKGISLNKEKRSQKVWDEATGTWMFRHGYQKANDDARAWPIMEVKDNEDPFEDPWELQREKKRVRVDKNIEQRMKNEERAGTLSKGSAARLLKNAKHRRDVGKLGGILDRDKTLPAGVPVDISKTKDAVTKRGKESTVKALLATQRSTASLGKFDKMREGEPARRKSESKALKKQKGLGSTIDPKMMSSEHERSLKLLKTVVEGGSKRETDIKKGRHATGETAYDYDFDDGLGPSSFRKKKGRAGAGKLKKMTKKRVK